MTPAVACSAACAKRLARPTHWNSRKTTNSRSTTAMEWSSTVHASSRGLNRRCTHDDSRSDNVLLLLPVGDRGARSAADDHAAQSGALSAEPYLYATGACRTLPDALRTV